MLEQHYIGSMTFPTFEQDIERIESGEGGLSAMVGALDHSQQDPIKFETVKGSIRKWLEQRVRKLTEMKDEPDRCDGEKAMFERGIQRWQQSLDELKSGQNAFIPSGVNLIDGITVPADMGNNNSMFIYGNHIKREFAARESEA